jgi:hypothetical protein
MSGTATSMYDFIETFAIREPYNDIHPLSQQLVHNDICDMREMARRLKFENTSLLQSPSRRISGPLVRPPSFRLALAAARWDSLAATGELRRPVGMSGFDRPENHTSRPAPRRRRHQSFASPSGGCTCDSLPLPM